MDIETQGLGAGSYPEPKETKEQHIKAHVVVSYNLEFDVPENLNYEMVAEEIKDNFDEYEKSNEKIEEITIN